MLSALYGKIYLVARYNLILSLGLQPSSYWKVFAKLILIPEFQGSLVYSSVYTFCSQYSLYFYQLRSILAFYLINCTCSRQSAPRIIGYHCFGNTVYFLQPARQLFCSEGVHFWNRALTTDLYLCLDVALHAQQKLLPTWNHCSRLYFFSDCVMCRQHVLMASVMWSELFLYGSVFWNYFVASVCQLFLLLGTVCDR